MSEISQRVEIELDEGDGEGGLSVWTLRLLGNDYQYN